MQSGCREPRSPDARRSVRTLGHAASFAKEAGRKPIAVAFLRRSNYLRRSFRIEIEKMHIPPDFRETDIEVLHALIRSAGLGQFVTATADGPQATPLPLLLVGAEGPYGTLYGHMAKTNPQWRTAPIGDAMAIFMGADAYVHPGWYPSKRQTGEVVPTWNYEVVQARGPVTFFDDLAELLAVVTRLTDHQESTYREPWRVQDAPSEYIRRELKGIVGFRLRIDSLAGKRKLSQNRTPADRAGVIAGLEASACPNDRRAGQTMRERE